MGVNKIKAYSRSDTIVTYGLNDHQLALVSRMAETMGCKIRGNHTWQDIIAVPSFVAIIDRERLEADAWDVLLSFWREAGLDSYVILLSDQPVALPFNSYGYVKTIRPDVVEGKPFLDLLSRFRSKITQTDRTARLVGRRMFLLFQIYKRLSDGRYCRTSDLARELSISQRTVQRYIRLLEYAGEPLVYDPEKGAWTILSV